MYTVSTICTEIHEQTFQTFSFVLLIQLLSKSDCWQNSTDSKVLDVSLQSDQIMQYTVYDVCWYTCVGWPFFRITIFTTLNRTMLFNYAKISNDFSFKCYFLRLFINTIFVMCNEPRLGSRVRNPLGAWMRARLPRWLLQQWTPLSERNRGPGRDQYRHHAATS